MEPAPEPVPGRSGPLEAAILAHIADGGPIGYDEFMAHALYTPEVGFYAGGSGAGRRRDFLTSPEVGPLFGAVMARALDSWWDELGSPASFVLVEAGAGPGTLARAMRAASPRCLDALHHVLVEVAEVQWASHPDGVDTRPDMPAPGELPPGPVVILANELLDNLPFALVELGDQGWVEVTVDVGQVPGREVVDALHGEQPVPTLVEGYRPLPATQRAWCAHQGGNPVLGARFPVHHEAGHWLASAIDLTRSEGGRVVVIDYMSTSAEMARRPWTEWLRTYASHQRAGSPLEAPGSCDITTEVALDQLLVVAEAATHRSQAEFLEAHGIDDLVTQGRSWWADGGIRGGRRALEGASRIREAEALVDPDGLGGFTVAEWVTTPATTTPCV